MSSVYGTSVTSKSSESHKCVKFDEWQGGITWERKHKEIYDYCMKSKGWDVE